MRSDFHVHMCGWVQKGLSTCGIPILWPDLLGNFWWTAGLWAPGKGFYLGNPWAVQTETVGSALMTFTAVELRGWFHAKNWLKGTSTWGHMLCWRIRTTNPCRCYLKPIHWHVAWLLRAQKVMITSYLSPIRFWSDWSYSARLRWRFMVHQFRWPILCSPHQKAWRHPKSPRHSQ